MESTSLHTRVLIYSDDIEVRDTIRTALGAAIAADMPKNEIHEFATADALHAYIDEKGPHGQARADLIILDAEAVPEGGMGIARQFKDEIFNCPPILLVVARADDAWLARWSRADATLIHPIDPFTFAASAEALLRAHSAAIAGASL
ncbi:MAG: response regulator transcription factor [Actinobacteria bacterium]|nr:response regulator transcription factor [Actinomycetota bacterium]